MSFFGLSFGGNADIDILLDGSDERKMAEIKDENGRKERHLLYFDGESISGKVNLTLHRKTRSLEHQGIKIEFIGQIELFYDRGNHHEFLSLVKHLDGPGELTQNCAYDFEFNQVEKPYECYTGVNVRLRYFLRVTIIRRLTDMTKELDILVHTLATYPELNNPIKMEVGIEECLHIEFEYNKSRYHLKDVIVGKIYFLLVRIKIKYMEIAIIKRETTGAGPNNFNDNETIAKYEIMDGAPVRGESIPIRVFLAGYDLTPTMRDVNKKFSVRYYLNLVLVDEEERRYFKQQEITIWRKGERQARKGSVTYGISQVPHAMARHVNNMGAEAVTNVRTTEPPTPTADNEGQLEGERRQPEQMGKEPLQVHQPEQMGNERQEALQQEQSTPVDEPQRQEVKTPIAEDDGNMEPQSKSKEPEQSGTSVESERPPSQEDNKRTEEASDESDLAQPPPKETSSPMVDVAVLPMSSPPPMDDMDEEEEEEASLATHTLEDSEEEEEESTKTAKVAEPVPAT